MSCSNFKRASVPITPTPRAQAHVGGSGRPGLADMAGGGGVPGRPRGGSAASGASSGQSSTAVHGGRTAVHSGRTPVHSASLLQKLQATTMVDSKPLLPAEILAAVLDYLPVPDLMRFARTSHRMREMVYDDTRWVARLKAVGCWDEAEARRRFEDAMRRRRELAERASRSAHALHSRPPPPPPPAAPGAVSPIGRQQRQSSMTLFDATAVEEEMRREQQKQQQQQQQNMSSLREDFETMAVTGPSGTALGAGFAPGASGAASDPDALLDILAQAQSVRGHARHEYGRIYGALAPFYFDLVAAKTHADPAVFRVYRDPERQARMLAQLRALARSDWSSGWQRRTERLASMTAIFEAAVLREFEQGYRFWDVDGRMRRYAHVLDLLDGGTAAIDLFVQKHPLFSSDGLGLGGHDLEGAPSGSWHMTKERLLADNNPVDCINQATADAVVLEPSRRFLFDVLGKQVAEQASVIERVFPRPREVFWIFMDKVREELVMEYATTLFDETRERSMAAYLQAVSGLFEHTLQFYRSLQPPKDLPLSGRPMSETEQGKAEKQSLEKKACTLALATFEPHLDLYLQDELEHFTKHAEREVDQWDKKLAEQDASDESFFMANFNNRQADKTDFLTTFKKVVMMPVTVLPTSLGLPGLPIPSPFAGSSKPPSTPAGSTSGASHQPADAVQQPQTPGMAASAGRTNSPKPGGAADRNGTMAPTDELAAKAALMTSRLEGIRSLLSIEVALHLVHTAKTSLGRVAVFVQLAGQAGGEAREQCSAIFVALLRLLGSRHLKPGFDRAVTHLSQYNPREVAQQHHHHVDPHGRDDGSDTGAGAISKGSSSSSSSSSSNSNNSNNNNNNNNNSSNSTGKPAGLAPLVTFIELVNVGDLISQMIDVFYEQQLVAARIADRDDFLDPAGLAKKKFEQMLDESVAAGLNKGIDALMGEVEYICATTQLPTDYNPAAPSSNGLVPDGGGGGGGPGGDSTPVSLGGGRGAAMGIDIDIGPTPTARRVRDLVTAHTRMLVGSTDKSMLDVFNGEVGARLFAALCKHLKRQRVSMAGAIKLIADMNLYWEFVRTSLAGGGGGGGGSGGGGGGSGGGGGGGGSGGDGGSNSQQQDLMTFFGALRELSQIYLIDAARHAREMAQVIADTDRFAGVFRAEEVYEYAERRADWYQVRREVERAMYGLECCVS